MAPPGWTESLESRGIDEYCLLAYDQTADPSEAADAADVSTLENSGRYAETSGQLFGETTGLGTGAWVPRM